MIKKISLTTVLLFTVVGIINSQSVKPKKGLQLPSVALGMGVLSFDGDIGNGANLTSLSRVKGGYNLSIEERIGKIIGVSVNGIYGKLADTERGSTRNLNFESKIIQADVNLILHLDNDLLFKRNSIFAPYLFAGFGFLKFDSYGDLKNKDGIKYNYWTDGTIRNLPEDTTGSSILRRDYTYETKLNDSAKYANNTFSVPVGIGVNLKIVDNLYINLGASYYFTFSDWIDNFKSGRNDRYIFVNAAIQYNFANHDDDSNPIYQTIDFTSLDKLDTDGDGVIDADDRCPGTPKDVTVTPDGCPEDNDGDGVPDYLDQEPLTIVGRDVDKNGVTITENTLERQQKRYSSAATERSQLFNENPSMAFLKDVEAKSLNARKNNPKGTYNIPDDIKSADLNNDGYISPDEILKAIDAFFDGNSKVENLNDIIDFFFEQ